jgi:general secretion pathway protein C
MTRGRLVLSFLLFIALCASIAYWGLQLYDPPLRPVAAPEQSQAAAPRIEAAAAVFGGQASAPATNFQLRGVIVSGTPRESVAIIAEEGKPPKAYRVNTEIVPGVKVQEVHPQYVVISDGGAQKRVELPAARNASQGGIAARTAPVQSTPVQSKQGEDAQQNAQVQTAPAAGSTVVIQEGQPAAGAASESGTASTGEATAQPGETGEAANETVEEEIVEGTPSPEESAQGQANPPQR